MAGAQVSLRGKVVAITGGARGIGRATAAALLREGAQVAIGDIDAEEAARAAAALGAGTLGLKLDVTDPVSFERFIDETEARLGPLDVLVNNAGVMALGNFLQESDETAQLQISVNLTGVVIGSKLAARRFAARGHGHLVNVASTAGKFGAPGGATYSATKHAVVGLSETIRREVGPLGIDVSIVMPLVVNTDLGSGLHDVRGLKVLEPEDVAEEIVDALRRRRVDVFVPRWIGPVLRLQSIVPRPIVDALVSLLGADKVLSAPDAGERAAYAGRLDDASHARGALTPSEEQARSAP